MLALWQPSSYNDHMKRKKPHTVGSRELKTRLGTYLERVRRGETIVVTDRGAPIAELRPLSVSEDPVERALDEMAAEGLLTRPARTGTLQPIDPIKLPPGMTVLDLLSEDREDRI